MSLANSLQQFKQSFSEFWAGRDARERVMLTAAAAVVVLGLIYATLIAPAVTGREQMNKNLPLLRQQVAQLQALAKEAAALAAQPAPPLAVMSKESISTLLMRNNLKPQSVMLSGDQVEVQLTAASFASTLAWLDEMQKSARLVVVEANIVALPQADMANAKLTLRLSNQELSRQE